MKQYLLMTVAAWLSVLTCNAAAQVKLAPLPIYEQCASLSEAPYEKLKSDLVLLKGADAAARAEAVKRLSKACSQAAVEPLIDLLRDKNADTQVAVVETLGRLGAKEAIDPLRLSIDESDWRVRLALIPALASFKVFNARNAVLNGIFNPGSADISDETDMRVRCVAALTLNELTDVTYSRKAVQMMKQLLSSNHLNIRALAEQTMYALKDTRNGPNELIGILKQQHAPDLRRWACEWLGKLGIERARPALEEAANDNNAAVKHAAAEALAKLKP